MKPGRIENAPRTGNPALDAWLDQLVSTLNNERARLSYGFYDRVPEASDNAARGFPRGHIWLVPDIEIG